MRVSRAYNEEICNLSGVISGAIREGAKNGISWDFSDVGDPLSNSVQPPISHFGVSKSAECNPSGTFAPRPAEPTMICCKGTYTVLNLPLLALKLEQGLVHLI